jgi:hypothetical protein
VLVLGLLTGNVQSLTSEKAEMSRPAKNGALDSEETWKFRTSFQAYGSILVKAIGSATRTSARIVRFVYNLDDACDHSPSKKSWAAGKAFSFVFRGLVLRLVRKDILQPDLILTASPPRSVHKLSEG